MSSAIHTTTEPNGAAASGDVGAASDARGAVGGERRTDRPDHSAVNRLLVPGDAR